MNYWKISNLANRNAKIIISLAPNQSKGMILSPGEFCICRNTQTPVMDAQIRRKLIEVDKEFDNSVYNFEIGKAYPITLLNQMNQEEQAKMEQARIDAENYANKQN